MTGQSETRDSGKGSGASEIKDGNGASKRNDHGSDTLEGQ